MNGFKFNKENEFTLILQEKLNKELRKYGVVVVRGKHLIYKVIVKEKSKFEPDTPVCPKESSYSFETDLLVEDLLLNVCEEIIKEIKEIIKNNEKNKEYEELIKKCEELLDLIKNDEEYEELIELIKNKDIDDTNEKVNMEIVEELLDLIKNDEEYEKLIKECEELIKNQEYTEVINICKKLINKIRTEDVNKEYIDLIKEEYEKLIKECEELIKNQEYMELIDTCGKFINKMRIENLDKEYIDLIYKYKSDTIIDKFNELIENKKVEELVRRCKMLIKGIRNDREYIRLTKKCKKLIKYIKKLISKMENEKNIRVKYEELIKKFKEELFLLPLVVIEIKYGDFDTHNILAYSEKALKHKEIYPYLRYGSVIGNIEKIPNKFFKHNKGLDFAYSLKDINDDKSIKELVEIIKQQVDSARSILDIINSDKKIKKFNTIVEISFDKN